MVESCWITESLQWPSSALGPQTAAMKSRIIPSKKVLFQLVAGDDAVQLGGVSSGTTTCDVIDCISLNFDMNELIMVAVRTQD